MILLVEDEASLAESVRYNLEREGFRVAVAPDGRVGLERFRADNPSLVVLDLMLPEMSGLDLCKLIREESAVPIIMLTAKDAEADKVAGLELGADDYVTKPFSADELLARVEAVLRRSQFGETPARQAAFVAGDLSIDCLARRVTLRGEEVRLSPTEYRLLSCLAASPGVVLERDELVLYAQPILEIGSQDKFPMAEVLVRLREDDDLLLPPGGFLPLFDHFRLAQRLDPVDHLAHVAHGVPDGPSHVAERVVDGAAGVVEETARAVDHAAHGLVDGPTDVVERAGQTRDHGAVAVAPRSGGGDREARHGGLGGLL